MAITPTTLLRHVKAQLGATTRPLPVSDDDMMEVVLEETIPTFSKYYPYMYPIMVDPKTDELDSNDMLKSVFVMNTNGLEVLGVKGTYRTDGQAADARYPYYNTNNIYDIAVANNYLSMTQITDTFAFYPPSIIELYPKMFDKRPFMVIVKCVHLPSLQSIPIKLKDQFFDLATLDIKISFFPILKHYDQLNTPFGTIDLKVNDLEEAKSERNDLLEKFRSMYLKEPERKKIWIGRQ